MNKSTYRQKLPLKFIQNSRGQLSIFLGLGLLIIFTLLAFIINVGLFVKAKINLQNSVDAAAFAGASVQARQLTDMGYLNWEMRNTYKEWMFKYYVLGQISLKQVNRKEFGDSGSAPFDFKLDLFQNSGEATRDKVTDPYDVPSVCIDFAATHSICGMYTVPGLPRFEAVNLPDVTEIHEATINSLVRTKAKACAEKTQINFGTALTWAFGTGKPFSDDSPLISSHRAGAWPQAVELGFRMRNLEMIMNRPPVAQPICLSPNDLAPGCLSVDNLTQASGDLPFNERPIKAFMSAFRNLSGGAYKSGASPSDKLSRSFTLTELKPDPIEVNVQSLSGFLMPVRDMPDIAGSGVKATTKHYVDLKAVPINYVTFFTNYAPLTEDGPDSATAPFTGQVSAEGACRATKTAIPVPAYPTGFVKNPDVITYYAVKGQARFTGLFFPFSDFKGISMSAYAAAKPMGGRIGPMNFDVLRDETTVFPRAFGNQRSVPFATGVVPPDKFAPGELVPTAGDFWVSNRDSIVGGVPSANVGNIVYAIPNILMDFSDNFGDIEQHESHSAPFLIINKKGTTAAKGLYSTDQYRLLFAPANGVIRSGIGGGAGDSTGQSVLDAVSIDRMLEQVRKPTKYEALNYMVPTFEENILGNPKNLDTLTAVQPVGVSNNTGNQVYEIFAPLSGPGTLFPNSTSLRDAVADVINSSSESFDQFIGALEDTAKEIKILGRNTKECAEDASECKAYEDAANAIWNGDPRSKIRTPEACANFSLADKIHEFFLLDDVACGDKLRPLRSLMDEYFSEGASEGNFTIRASTSDFTKFFRASYVPPTDISFEKLHTGYAPGRRQGAANNGLAEHPFLKSQAPELMKRNSYSAKFIALEKLFKGGEAPYGAEWKAYTEIHNGSSPTDIAGLKGEFKNTLRVDELEDSSDIQNTKH